MLKRAVSALVGIALFLAICFGSALLFALGITVLAMLCGWEWESAYRRARTAEAAGEPSRVYSRFSPLNVIFVLLGCFYPLGLYFALQHTLHPELLDALIPVVPVLLFALLTLRSALTGKALGGVRRWYGLIGMVYIGLLFGSLVLLRSLGSSIRVAPFGRAERGAWLTLFVAVCVWATDTFAYFAGKGMGRHKLAPRLSPGKTVEGSLGGLIGAVLVGAAFGVWIHLPLRDGLIVGAIAGVVGQIGDLWESALKRELGIKDFGGVMPGHGGALDRFDSLLFVAPLAYLYLAFIAK